MCKLTPSSVACMKQIEVLILPAEWDDRLFPSPTHPSLGFCKDAPNVDPRRSHLRQDFKELCGKRAKIHIADL